MRTLRCVLWLYPVLTLVRACRDLVVHSDVMLVFLAGFVTGLLLSAFQTGMIYSFNEGNYALWDDSVKAYMDSLKDPSKWGGKPYSVSNCALFLLNHNCALIAPTPGGADSQ